MWGYFRFLHMTDVKNSEISPLHRCICDFAVLSCLRAFAWRKIEPQNVHVEKMTTIRFVGRPTKSDNGPPTVITFPKINFHPIICQCTLFSYASSSTLIPLSVSQGWAEFRTSVAPRLASLFLLNQSWQCQDFESPLSAMCSFAKSFRSF